MGLDWIVAAFALTGLGIGLLAVVAATSLRSDDASGRTESALLNPAAVGLLASWLGDNTIVGTRVAAPAGTRAQLAEALPGRTLVRYVDAASGDLVVLRRGQPQAPGALTMGLLSASAPVALLDTRAGAVEVRQLRPPGVSRAAEQNGRRAVGRQLVGRVELRLTPQAWEMLARGEVDVRVVALVADLLRSHTVEVSSFPRDSVTRAAGAPARSVSITAMDGRALGQGLARTPLTDLNPAAVGGPDRVALGRDHGRQALVATFFLETAD
jgi:hypothetical protein